MTSTATAFVGSIPELYDEHLGPAFFEPYALDVARRVPADARRVLEIAAGTGRLTRQVLARIAPDATLRATDLNEAMVQRGSAVVRDPRVTWAIADAQALPEADAAYDVVLCQFGLMFVPDKPRALAEMRRVLADGGTLLLSTWNSLAHNGWASRVHQLAMATVPDDPPRFMEVPYGMYDPGELRRLVAAAGFARVAVETVDITGEVPSAAKLAIGLVRGNPLAGQLEARGVDIEALIARVTERVASDFGDAPCRAPLSAHIVRATA